jgi:hypothetical protein
MGRNVLVVLSDAVDADDLPQTLAAELEPDANVRVVGSPSLSPLEWLTNDEDEARREALDQSEIAARAAGGKAAEAPGDPAPLQAAEDALRTFPADEVIVVAPAGATVDTTALEAGDVPVRRLTVDAKD